MSMTEVKQATGTIEKQDESNVVVKVDEVLSSFTGEKAELIPILQQV
jgi:hypothetical protein